MIENAETSLTPTGLTKWQDYEDFHPEYIDAIV